MTDRIMESYPPLNWSMARQYPMECPSCRGLGLIVNSDNSVHNCQACRGDKTVLVTEIVQ